MALPHGSEFLSSRQISFARVRIPSRLRIRDAILVQTVSREHWPSLNDQKTVMSVFQLRAPVTGSQSDSG